jgi:aminoglycoside phosphotransferase (APT) family kinase protein
MVEPTQSLKQIADGLVQYLRTELDNPAIGYDSPLTQLQGGYETSTYRFQLGGAGPGLAGPLVLRLYPPRLDASHAAWERTIQNVLAGEGYPVARVHLTCTDPSVLGGVFLIMECLDGELMLRAPFETIPGLLGTTHAALHEIDPAPLISALQEGGWDTRRYRLAGRLQGLQDQASAHPWLNGAVEWLIRNCPPEPERLSICHGDYHPMNILVQDGRVTGVLDWGGFMIADPSADVATTIVLTSISAKHILSLEEWEPAVEMYLDAYQAQRPLDLSHLDFYRVRRCIIALVDGANGQAVWQHPGIVGDLLETVHAVTGIRVEPKR